MDLLGPVAAIVGDGNAGRDVRVEDASGLSGIAPVLARPGNPEEVRELVAWAYREDVPILPVGGMTGFAGGVVPLDDPCIAVSLERLASVRSFDPLLWRMEIEAGATTATVQRLARENGLMFPPDPGAAEQSQIGGNLATNAGGPVRKDVAGYDLRGLLIGSEGTLGIITAAWLRFIPAPPMAVPVIAGYASISAGVEAIEAAVACGVVPATLEYLQGDCLRYAPPPFLHGPVPEFIVICEAESELERAALLEALGPGAAAHDPREVWRWRGGVSIGVRAARGEKLSEDIAVPLDRLREAIERTLEIGARHELAATSWGHAGDGNLHSTFMYDPANPEKRQRAEAAATELFELARELGGSVSGEHGLGLLKRGQLLGQWSPGAVGAHEAIKRALDPKGLFNPGKKEPRPGPGEPGGLS